MKKTGAQIFIFLYFLLCFHVSRTHALPWPLLSINTGFTRVMQPRSFSNHWVRGLNVGGGAGFYLSENTQLLTTGRFHVFQPARDVHSESNAIILSLSLNLKKRVPANNGFETELVPYYIFGAGITRFIHRNVYATDSEGKILWDQMPAQKGTETGAAAGLGLGIDFTIFDDSLLFVQFQCVYSFIRQNPVYFPLVIGIAMD